MVQVWQAPDLPALDPGDYRRLFRVVEDVAGVGPVPATYEALVDGLARHMGWRRAYVIDRPAGPRPGAEGALAAGRPGCHHRFMPSFARELLERWRDRNPFASAPATAALRARGVAVLSDVVGHLTPGDRASLRALTAHHDLADVVKIAVARGDSGVLTVSVPFREEVQVGQRERVLAARLRRVLAPILRPPADPTDAVGATAPAGATGPAGSVLPPPAPAAATREVGGAVPLTPREREVVALVTRGLTNRQIADALVVSVDTVKKHLTRALDKSGCQNRTQLAVLGVVP